MRYFTTMMRTCGVRIAHIFRRANRGVKYRYITRRRKKRDRLTIPGYQHCKNCGAELMGIYCHRCGQYALDINQSAFKYIKQFAENTYQYDGRLWATIRMIFCRPGKLTSEFAAGRINSYVHPLKLYMFMSLIFFSFVLLTLPEIREAENKGNPFADKIALREADKKREDSLKNWTRQDGAYKEHTDSLKRAINSQIIASLSQEPSVEPLVDSNVALPDASRQKKADSMALFKSDTTTVMAENGKKTASTSVEEEDDDEDDLKFFFIKEIRSSIPIVMLFLVPLYGMILRFQYRKQCKQYMNCLVFALHFHTILLICMSVIIVTLSVPYLDWLDVALMWLLFMYLIIASRNFYGVSWFRATIRSIFGLSFYLFICLLVFLSYLVYRFLFLSYDIDI